MDDLARELGLSNEIVNSVSEFNGDYAMSRYPDVSERAPFEEYSEEIAIDKTNIAKSVFGSLVEEYGQLLEDGDE